MKAADLIKISKIALELLSQSDIKMSDWRYVTLYEEYERMKDDGVKISYIVAHLSAKYSISEASIYRLVRRFNGTIKV